MTTAGLRRDTLRLTPPRRIFPQSTRPLRRRHAVHPIDTPGWAKARSAVPNKQALEAAHRLGQ